MACLHNKQSLYNIFDIFSSKKNRQLPVVISSSYLPFIIEDFIYFLREVFAVWRKFTDLATLYRIIEELQSACMALGCMGDEASRMFAAKEVARSMEMLHVGEHKGAVYPWLRREEAGSEC